MFIENISSDNSQKLRLKRESLGFSPDDVFKKIRIRASYLQAMENGEFHLLPDPVYTKNFIKIYAKFLGVDEEPILKDYNDYINRRKEAQMPPPETPPEEKHLFPPTAHKKNYWGIIFVLTIVLVIWLILKQTSPVSEEITSGDKTNSSLSGVSEQNANLTSNAVSTANQQMTGSALSTGNAAILSGNIPGAANINDSAKKNPAMPMATYPTAGGAQKSDLFIAATQETWIRIKPGNNPPVQILLKPGEQFAGNADFFNLDIGNAGGVQIKYKGKSVENTGKTGEVIHIRLPQLKQ